MTRLATIDPDYYLAHTDSPSTNDDWWSTSDLNNPENWPDIAREYAAGIGSASLVVGGSLALQRYTWRIAGLTTGRWALTGRGLPLANIDVRIQMSGGKTRVLDVPEFDEQIAPTTPEGLADHLVIHLRDIVQASRSVSRLRVEIAWGNVASAIAASWRRVHDGAPCDRRPSVFNAAAACLQSDAWPWDTPPLTLGSMTTITGPVLIQHRHTCCLMRLVPAEGKCASCSFLGSQDVHSRWSAKRTDAPVARFEFGDQSSKVPLRAIK